MPWQEGIGNLSESNREETRRMEMQLLCVLVCLTLFSFLFSQAAQLYFMCWLGTVRKMVPPATSEPEEVLKVVFEAHSGA